MFNKTFKDELLAFLNESMEESEESFIVNDSKVTGFIIEEGILGITTGHYDKGRSTEESNNENLLALNKWVGKTISVFYKDILPDLSYVDSKKYIKVYPLTDNSMMNKYKIKKLYENNEDVTVRVLIRSHVCDFNTTLGWVPELDVTLLPPLDVDQIYNIKNMVLKVLDYVEPVPYANVAGTEEYAEAVSKELKKICEDYVRSGSFSLEYKSKYLAVKIKVSKRVDLDSTVEMLRNL